jgi:kynurenine formamidase
VTLEDAGRAEVRGAVRNITPEVIVGARTLVKRGEVIPLNARIDDPNPAVGRQAARRSVRMHNSPRAVGDGRFVIFNDDSLEFPLQGSSHIDALAHCGVLTPGRNEVFHGGANLEEVHPEPVAKSLGIEAYGGAIVTRGVLVDVVAEVAPETGMLPDGYRVTDAVLEACLGRQATELRPGDAVLLFTGFEARRRQLGGNVPAATAGIDGSSLRLWREARVSLIACDNLAVEAYPGDYAVHIGALVELGIPLGELWALEQLAASCRRDHDYEFLLVSVPLNLPGAFGSPANAVAVR